MVLSLQSEHFHSLDYSLQKICVAVSAELTVYWSNFISKFTCEASPWSHSPLRFYWRCQWWSWGPEWAIRTLPDQSVSLKTTSSGEIPQTCEEAAVLFLHSVTESIYLLPKLKTSTNLQILWIFSSWLLKPVEESEEPQTDLVDLIVLFKRVLFSSGLNCMIPGVSNFSLIHWHCSMSLMNINSTPICWQ